MLRFNIELDFSMNIITKSHILKKFPPFITKNYKYFIKVKRKFNFDPKNVDFFLYKKDKWISDKTPIVEFLKEGSEFSSSYAIYKISFSKCYDNCTLRAFYDGAQVFKSNIFEISDF